MSVSTNRIIEVNLTSDPTNALAGTVLSMNNGMLEQAQTVQMNAEVVGTANIMQANDTIDLDNNGTFESLYGQRFNFPTSTYTLSNGTTVSSAVTIIKVTTGGVPHYYLIISNSIAAQIDTYNIASITPGGTMALSPNTDGANFDDATSYVLVCFASETRILTEAGEREISSLKAGDRVWVMDRGYVPLKWTGQRTVRGQGAYAPVVFAKGAIGNHRTLRVSPQHRMYVGGAQVELMLGTPDALVTARHLVGKPGVTRQECGEITYVHLMFDTHSVISAEGALSESYFPGEYSLDGQDMAAQNELSHLFPELRSIRKNYAQTCLPCLDRREARLLDLLDLLDLRAVTGREPMLMAA